MSELLYCCLVHQYSDEISTWKLKIIITHSNYYWSQYEYPINYIPCIVHCNFRRYLGCTIPDSCCLILSLKSLLFFIVMSFELFIVQCCLKCLPDVQTNPQTAMINRYIYIYILSTANQWQFILQFIFKFMPMYE